MELFKGGHVRLAVDPRLRGLEVCMCGDGGVGKTSLVCDRPGWDAPPDTRVQTIAYLHHLFGEAYDPTVRLLTGALAC